MRAPVRPKSRYLVFGAPCLGPEEAAEVEAALKSGWIGTGPRVARFEECVRAAKGAPFAAAVGSCTAALHLSLLACGVGPGDEVVTTALTFCATVNAIVHTGATPVLADVEEASQNLSPAEVERRLTPRTRTLVPVHFAGRPCDMDRLMDLAETRGLSVVEDCAHAIETEHRGRKAGTFGDFGCLSFYVTKNVTTGEGGMVLCRSAPPMERIKTLALHGLSTDAWRRFSDDGYRHYSVTEAGFKYNMTDLQAAIGLEQWKKLEPFWRRRKEIWGRYQEAFGDLPVLRPAEPEPDTRHAYHLYALRIDEARAGLCRDAFLVGMHAQNIGVGVHYRSLPEHPYYRERFGWRPEDYPNACRIGRETVSLPLSPGLTDDDVEDVVEAVRRVLA